MHAKIHRVGRTLQREERSSTTLTRGHLLLQGHQGSPRHHQRDEIQLCPKQDALCLAFVTNLQQLFTGDFKKNKMIRTSIARCVNNAASVLTMI